MSLLVVSGISGAGKSLFSNTMEDMGFNCIDNLPPSLLVAVSKLKDNNKLVVIIDSRSKDKYETLLSEIEKLKADKVDHKLLFLDCEKDIILGRYKYTRRPHPLMSDEHPSLEDAIDYEYKLSKQIKDASDIVVDTTKLTPNQLKKTVVDMFKEDDYHGLTIKIISFGFKNGLPSEADLVYDVRCMPNPFYVPELKVLSGMDDPVVDYVFSFEQSVKMLNMMKEFISYTLPYYVEEGKNELVIAIGCTSGHHRSVSFARKLANEVAQLQHKVVVLHRDIEKNY